MTKLVKDLQTDDTVYVVEVPYGKLSNKIIECKIKIEFDKDERFGENREYVFKAFRGYLDSGNTKFWHGFVGQVIRTSTVCYVDENKELPKKKFNALSETSSVTNDKYKEILNSESFSILGTIIVFTSKEAAQNYIVDFKLKEIKNEMKKSIRIIKYKKKDG